MGLMKNFFQQTRKPEGFLGKMMVGGMNGSGHAKLADWGMSHIEGVRAQNIAELGCGSGALTIACAKKNPKAGMVGIDRWGKEYASFRLFVRAMPKQRGLQTCPSRRATHLNLIFPTRPSTW